MTNPQRFQAPGRTGEQTKIAIIAGITLSFSVGIFVASQLGALTQSISTSVVLIGMGVLLKLLG
jgi:hypothetical protein